MASGFEFEDKNIAWAALNDYRARNVNLADYLIGRKNRASGCEETVTFNKALKQLPACAGPRDARPDFPVSLAPSVTAQLSRVLLRSPGPRPPCGRAACASGARETLAHNSSTARWPGLLRPPGRAYLVLLAIASLSLARSGGIQDFIASADRLG